jgi:hypothetical protein
MLPQAVLPEYKREPRHLPKGGIPAAELQKYDPAFPL